MIGHNDIKFYWDKNAENWFLSSEEGLDIWRDHVNTPAFLNMLPDLSDKIGLEIGCGDAHNSRIIAERSQSLCAMDISEKFLRLSKNVKNPNNICYCAANAVELPFSDEYFSFVVSIMFLMDTFDLDKILDEIYRVLSPAGFFQFSITHPCFNEFKGKWIVKDGRAEGLLVKDYFLEVKGDIHEWKHLKSPENMPCFQVPRFLKPLNVWINKLIEHGFLIEELREPSASDEAIKKYPELATTRQVAHSLIVRVKKNNEFQRSLREVTEKLPGNVWWKDKNLKYLGCNDRVIEVLGLGSRRNFIGKTDYELWDKNIAEKLEKADTYVLQTGETISLEEVIVEAGNKVVTMLTNKSPLHDKNGNIAGILGTSTDITELKETQADLKKAEGQLDGMMTLSASIAHELRTPLTSIRAGARGLIDLFPALFDAYNLAKKNGLEVKPISEKALELSRNSLERIDNSARRAHQIIDMILTGIRADRNIIKENDLCSIKECIDSALSEYVFQPKKDKLVHLKESNDFTFSGSEIQVKHIIFNLLRNSLYFIEKAGKGEIYIWTDQDEKFNELHFKDTGPGISQEILSRIFDRFFTADTHRGTGIGLSFCKMVMESMGGKIECLSEVNKYTEFVLYFPK